MLLNTNDRLIRKAADAALAVVALLAVVPLILTEHYGWGIGVLLLGVFLAMMVEVFLKCRRWKRYAEGNYGADRINQPNQTPIYSVSSSTPHAPFSTGPPPPLHTTSAWPSSPYSPSVPTLPTHNNPSNFTGHMNVEDARRYAASLQPPAYPEVVQDSPRLPPLLYTTPATDKASAGVFGPSNDGLPCYETAMSTWQPPADEGHPIRRDDPPRMND